MTRSAQCVGGLARARRAWGSLLQGRAVANESPNSLCRAVRQMGFHQRQRRCGSQPRVRRTLGNHALSPPRSGPNPKGVVSITEGARRADSTLRPFFVIRASDFVITPSGYVAHPRWVQRSPPLGTALPPPGYVAHPLWVRRSPPLGTPLAPSGYAARPLRVRRSPPLGTPLAPSGYGARPLWVRGSHPLGTSLTPSGYGTRTPDPWWGWEGGGGDEVRRRCSPTCRERR